MHDLNIVRDLVGKKDTIGISLRRREANDAASATVAVDYKIEVELEKENEKVELLTNFGERFEML